MRYMSFSCRVKELIPLRPPYPMPPCRAERVKHIQSYRKWNCQKTTVAYLLSCLHGCVILQAVLDFHRQVGNVVSHISDQYKELFGTEHSLSETSNREQMKTQLMGALNVSGKYFTFKERMKVGTTTHTTLMELWHGVWWLTYVCCVACSCEGRTRCDAVERAIHWPTRAEGFYQQALCLSGGSGTHNSQQGNTHIRYICFHILHIYVNLYPLLFTRSIQAMLMVTLWMKSTWVLLSSCILPEKLSLMGIISRLFSTTKR